jgi:hypothetical protein
MNAAGQHGAYAREFRAHGDPPPARDCPARDILRSFSARLSRREQFHPAGTSSIAVMGLQIADAYAGFRPSGRTRPERLMRLVAAAISAARARRHCRLLIDLSSAAQWRDISLIERYRIGERWALAAAGHVRVAVVLAPGCLAKHEDFTITVANNRGLRAAAFASEAEALPWLLGTE